MARLLADYISLKTMEGCKPSDTLSIVSPPTTTNFVGTYTWVKYSKSPKYIATLANAFIGTRCGAWLMMEVHFEFDGVRWRAKYVAKLPSWTSAYGRHQYLYPTSEWKALGGMPNVYIDYPTANLRSLL